MNRFIVELDLESDWTADDLRDAMLDGMGYPLNVEREPHRVRVISADWQPIETAPKDGRKILVTDGDGLAVISFGSPDTHPPSRPRWVYEAFTPSAVGFLNPTHWTAILPLPRS